MKFVAVTSCPTGIAHTFMAAEALEEAATARGHEIVIETQGASGYSPMNPDDIAGAGAVIFAADAAVRDRERFARLPAVEVRVGDAINRAEEILTMAEQAAVKAPAAEEGAPAAPPPPTPMKATKGGKVRQWLMTGVSYMIPFVTAGGIMIAIAFALGGAVEVTQTNVLEEFSWGALFFKIGATAFSMLVPILAGFIAYAIADRPGIAPGVIGGLLANEVGAGFLGGIVVGLLAGGIVLLIQRNLPVPPGLRGLMPVLVIPLIATFVVGFLILEVIGEPIAGITTALTDSLEGLRGANALVLGIILGLMMAFDMGGPVNKVAYTFGLGLIAAGVFAPHAAIMAAGMTPPLGLALATGLRPRFFTHSEREAGKAAWLLGASFITEGAIPFAAADPLRVIPSIMAGSAVAGGLSMAFNATLRAPHGGIFVFGLIGNWPLWLLSIAIGTVVTTVLAIALKAYHPARKAAAGAETPAHA